jgi:hypothetical protein
VGRAPVLFYGRATVFVLFYVSSLDSNVCLFVRCDFAPVFDSVRFGVILRLFILSRCSSSPVFLQYSPPICLSGVRESVRFFFKFLFVFLVFVRVLGLSFCSVSVKYPVLCPHGVRHMSAISPRLTIQFHQNQALLKCNRFEK